MIAFRELAPYFARTTRDRGERYASEGRVVVRGVNRDGFSARVTGTEYYDVVGSLQDGELLVTCTCPFALDSGPCKHMWATLLVLVNRGELQPLLQDAVVFATGGDDPPIGLDTSAVDATPHEFAREHPPLSPDVGPLAGSGRSGGPAANGAPRTPWQQVLDRARSRASYEQPAPTSVWPADRRLVYLIDGPASSMTPGLVVLLATERRLTSGEWGVPKLFRARVDEWLAVPDPADRQLAQMLRGAPRQNTYYLQQETTHAGFVVERGAFDTTLRLLCETGRCRLRREHHDHPTEALRWDGDAAPWELLLRVDRTGDTLLVRGVLAREGTEMPLEVPDFIHSSGVIVAGGRVSRYAVERDFGLLTELRANGPLRVPDAQLPALLARLHSLPRLPRLELPPGIALTVERPAPVPSVALTTPTQAWNPRYRVALSFRYGERVVSADAPGATIFDERTLTVTHRDEGVEALAEERLQALGARVEFDVFSNRQTRMIERTRMPELVRALVGDGWQVTVDGVRRRAPTGMDAAVESSGIDWFELRGEVRFGDLSVPLPEILQALREGRAELPLADGSTGSLPADWRERLAPLMTAMSLAGGARFRRSQTALLDALLASRPEVSVDETFARARAELAQFDRVKAAKEPRTFRGTLREYQREGLGWLHFLERFGLGGCLADDMGLGKTIQVLALLEQRRLEGAGPSLVVVPRSLVFNWREEAARFTPALRVLDHTGTQRERGEIDVSGHDLMIATYGTLRRDAAALAAIEFDYAILDEAQAIKNATTAASKASRLLRARHRLALTGTPIENRLEELWSLFEFLDPGMLGSASAFRALARRRASAEPARDDAGRALLARALRPVILRRTKAQVASELPERTEQTVLVQLEKTQRKHYDELLAHYRRSLLPEVARRGIGRTRMHVLEALLRLRQAALHPALIDPKRRAEPSAKLDALLPMLVEAAAEDHKVIVFSQFTSLLALVRERLAEEGISFEYLDGQTRDRQARVERFQSDAGCRVFLVSLRAGGHGLNLTAADYVFLLDPWWNPAVEAQAIDRAHRIGQTRRVVATRLVAHDTIEEKILELQRTKRDLADAILSEDKGVLAGIGPEELALLLG